MQIKKASLCTVLIILGLNCIDGLNKSEPQGDRNLFPPTECHVYFKRDAVEISGLICNEVPKGLASNVAALSITASNITRIQLGDFAQLPHLKSVTIDLNPRLQEIDEGVFSNLTSLVNLTITNNARIEYIRPDTFAGLINLQHLVLSENSLMDFQRVSHAARSDILPTLISLDVSGNTFHYINYTEAYPFSSATLEELRLSSCSIANIDGSVFNNLPNLTTLYVDNNNLQTFVVLELILNISASSNHLTEIHIGANSIMDPNIILSHVSGTHISIIDLSFSRFVSVISGGMYTLPRVTYLDISSSRSRLPDDLITEYKFPNLEYLFLSSNYVLNRPFYMSLPKLRSLDLSNNVNSVCHSIFTTGFQLDNMLALEFLNLNSNPIAILMPSSFANLPALKELNLSNTSIQSFRRSPFYGLGSLETLDLSSNLFSAPGSITNTTFIGLTNLETLILDNSMLTCLEDDNTFTHTPNLQHLSLSRNSFLELHHFLLYPVPLLNILNLSYNSFQSWDQRIFKKNTNLETLDLSHNQISSFTAAMLQDFSCLRVLNLDENALSCDCSVISNVFPYTEPSSVQTQSALITALTDPNTYCSLPSDLRYSSFWLTASKLREDGCENNMEFMSTFVVIVGSGIVLSIPILYFLRWHIKYWLFLLRQSMTCYIFPKRKNTVPPGKYLYDAFVSYSNEDRGFVVRLVAMLENRSPRFRLCVFERDFQVGGVITNNVVESLAKSKRTILILSDAFARSTWCRWEMNLAQHKRLFFKDDQQGPLIIIKIGEIMEKHMTPTLRYLTKTRIYLQWNSDIIKQKVFWEKLRSALAAPLNDGDDDRPALQHAVLSNGETVMVDSYTNRANHWQRKKKHITGPTRKYG